MADSHLYLKSYLGPKRQHWLREDGTLPVVRFRFSAAFWSFFWFWYQRMWVMGFVVLVAFYGLNPVLKTLLTPHGVPCVVVEVIHLVMMAALTGFLGPLWFAVVAKIRIARVLKKYAEADELVLKQVLMRAGRSNLKGTLYVVFVPFGVLLGLLLLNYLQAPDLVTKAFVDAWRAGGCGV